MILVNKLKAKMYALIASPCAGYQPSFPGDISVPRMGWLRGARVLLAKAPFAILVSELAVPWQKPENGLFNG
jgi:hypothetical protein